MCPVRICLPSHQLLLASGSSSNAFDGLIAAVQVDVPPAEGTSTCTTHACSHESAHTFDQQTTKSDQGSRSCAATLNRQQCTLILKQTTMHPHSETQSSRTDTNTPAIEIQSQERITFVAPVVPQYVTWHYLDAEHTVYLSCYS